MSGPLDAILPIRFILREVGETWRKLTHRPYLAIRGDAVTITDDPSYVDDRGRTVGMTLVEVDNVALSDATPLAPSGAGSAGTSEDAARADHVHPASAGSSLTGDPNIGLTASGSVRIAAESALPSAVAGQVRVHSEHGIELADNDDGDITLTAAGGAVLLDGQGSGESALTSGGVARISGPTTRVGTDGTGGVALIEVGYPDASGTHVTRVRGREVELRGSLSTSIDGPTCTIGGTYATSIPIGRAAAAVSVTCSTFAIASATGAPGYPASLAWTSTVTMAGHRRMVFSGDGTEPCILALAPGATHEVGATLVAYIPAGEAGSLIASADLGADAWDIFDPAKGYEIEIRCTGSGSAREFVSSGRVIEPRVVDAPVIVSADANGGDPDALVVTWDQPVYVPALTGLSLSFSSGTPRTLSSVASGNGTTTVTFALSGALDGTEVFDLVVGGTRVAQSLDGDLITAETEAVSLTAFNFFMAGATHAYRADVNTLSGSDLATLTDRVGSDDLTASGTISSTTLGGQAAWDLGAEGTAKHISGDWAAQETLTSGAIFAVFELATTTPAGGIAPVSTGRHGALTTYEHLLFAYTTTGLLADRGGSSTGRMTEAPAPSGLAKVLFTWNGTSAQLWVNGVQEQTDSTTVGATAIRRLMIGAQPDGSTWHGGLKIAEVQIGNQHLTGGDVTEVFDYADARYV